jgi:hypothetical protein
MPKEVIPPAKMEKVLYDYHLTLGISSQLSGSEEYKKQAYKNYLFKKHQITEAQFDSSMVWYTRNSYELSKIYQNLDKRFSREKTKLTSMLQERHIDITTQAGDTVNIWHYYPVYWLTDAPMNNKFTFSMNADTNFWVKDAFAWNADITFLNASRVTMGLNIRYQNDSVTGKTIAMTQPGSHTLYVPADSLNEIKDINGFIYVDKDSVHQTPNVLISNISLIKYHQSKDKTAPKAETKDEKESKELLKLEENTQLEPKKSNRNQSRPKKQAPKN